MRASIGFDQQVDRRLVHRASTSEVLPTDFVTVSDHVFLAGLQWPRAHSFYHIDPVDSALVVESIRQLTILTAHLGLAVPMDARFVMPSLGFTVRGDVLTAPGQALQLATSLAACRVRRTASGRVRSIRVLVRIRQDDRTIATGYGDALLLTNHEYSRLRGPRLHARPHAPAGDAAPRPSEVGRLRDHDVTVRRSDAGFTVISDLANSTWFDHIVDHVPGAALIEACLQAVRVERDDPSLDFLTLDARFHHIVEFDAPNNLVTSGRETTHVSIRQSGRTCVSASGALHRGRRS
jgi:hypothetical protein